MCHTKRRYQELLLGPAANESQRESRFYFSIDQATFPQTLVVLISRPERFLKLSSRVSKWSTESRSRTKTVVSSAYRETLISFSPTLMPFMPLSFLIALPSISMPITNNSPDNGQPCLTPRSTGKNSDPNPLLRTQLETLLYKILTQFLMFGLKLNFSRQLLIKSFQWYRRLF